MTATCILCRKTATIYCHLPASAKGWHCRACWKAMRQTTATPNEGGQE